QCSTHTSQMCSRGGSGFCGPEGGQASDTQEIVARTVWVIDRGRAESVRLTRGYAQSRRRARSSTSSIRPVTPSTSSGARPSIWIGRNCFHEGPYDRSACTSHHESTVCPDSASYIARKRSATPAEKRTVRLRRQWPRWTFGGPIKACLQRTTPVSRSRDQSMLKCW